MAVGKGGGFRENGSGAYWFEVGIGLRRPLYKWVWKGEKGKEIWGEYFHRRSGAISATAAFPLFLLQPLLPFYIAFYNSPFFLHVTVLFL